MNIKLRLVQALSRRWTGDRPSSQPSLFGINRQIAHTLYVLTTLRKCISPLFCLRTWDIKYHQIMTTELVPHPQPAYLRSTAVLLILKSPPSGRVVWPTRFRARQQKWQILLWVKLFFNCLWVNQMVLMLVVWHSWFPWNITDFSVRLKH